MKIKTIIKIIYFCCGLNFRGLCLLFCSMQRRPRQCEAFGTRHVSSNSPLCSKPHHRRRVDARASSLFSPNPRGHLCNCTIRNSLANVHYPRKYTRTICQKHIYQRSSHIWSRTLPVTYDLINVNFL